MDKIYIKSRMADTVGLTGGLSSEITLTSDRNDELGLKGTLYAENNLKGMLDFAKGEKGDPFTYEDFTKEQLESLKGETGNSAFEDWLLKPGNTGKTFDEFMESLKGEKGEDGIGMTEEEREQLERNTSDIIDIYDRLDEEREQLEQHTTDIASIFDMFDIVDTPPTYTNPTLSLNIDPATIQHNTNTSITIKPNFVQNDAGTVAQYTLLRNGSPIHTATSTSSYTDTVSINHGNSVTYQATVIHGNGQIKNTLLGKPYPNTSIKAGTISSSGTVRAYALSYYGVISSEEVVDISALNSRLSTSKSYTYTTDLANQKIVYMYPKSFGVLTSIKDANNFDYIDSYRLTISTYSGVEYYIYVLHDPVTITNFKQIFN